jgi:hypothetical protein
VFTARYGLSPYIKETRLVFKSLMNVGLDFPVREVSYRIFLDYARLQSVMLVRLFRRDILPPFLQFFIWDETVCSWETLYQQPDFTASIKGKVTMISRRISFFRRITYNHRLLYAFSGHLARKAACTDGQTYV